MYDGLSIALIGVIFSKYIAALRKKGLYVNRKTGEVFYGQGKTTHMFVSRKSNKKWGKYVEIRGSLHKFFTDGSNDGIFTYSQARIALRQMRKLFMVPWNARVSRLEYGFNITIADPVAVVDDAILYNGIPRMDKVQKFQEDKHNAEWLFNENCNNGNDGKGNGGRIRKNYEIKFYKKSADSVRFEYKAYRMDKHFPFIKLFRDLAREETVIVCQEIVFDAMRKMDFVPLAFIESLPESQRDNLRSYREGTNWEKYRKQNRSKVYHERKKLKRLLEELGGQDYNWSRILLDKMIVVADTMLGLEVSATNSQQKDNRLLGESVACGKGACDAIERDYVTSESETSLSVIHILVVAHEAAMRAIPGMAVLIGFSNPAAEPPIRGPPSLVVSISYAPQRESDWRPRYQPDIAGGAKPVGASLSAKVDGRHQQ